ncbi:hypothetical protein D9757_006854 [Collybiopsis confluens]|uniref:DH domain-containing protein n=1 Tax=Collybiopsis confluens TaxID=2823264 RepID=A0A8H5MAY1_9AGAR|nr:hypothetical protein D9757_006854 [Collybiopsis confluens]
MAANEGRDQVQPRSRRVGIARPRSTYDRPLSPSSTLLEDSSSLPPKPTLPVRSPLRPPPARSVISVSSQDSALSSAFIKLSTPTSSSSEDVDPAIIMPLSFQIRNRSFPSLPDSLSEDVQVSKALPLRPDSPLALSPMEDEAASSSSASSLAQPSTPAFTKRQHALHELLASERAYASDLALVREVYIPLAIGHPILNSLPLSPPRSSGSSSRTLSTASDSSTGSTDPPMTTEDAKIIFSNIAELALFSDAFCDKLQDALGAILDGGTGEDHVGALFRRMIPEMERPYKHYIVRQGTADEHLQALPKTTALEGYFSQTRSYSTSVSHAWDLHSLLIKPVQRLLKYPLLLGTILDETPDSHPDKENLRIAKGVIEELARAVNEERRRAEVVKGVLSGDPKKKLSATNISIAASVNLSKVKSMRKSHSADGEAAKVERLEGEMKKIEKFAQQFAKDVVGWSKSMSVVVQRLIAWAESFGQVIGLSDEQGSEAFDAFVGLLRQYLGPLSLGLESVINERLLKEIAMLLATMQHPMKLLESMNEQEPFHYHLLTMPVTPKNRPPQALLEASTNYLALRGQLSKELPRYLLLLQRGIALSIRRLADIQTQFWQDVRDRWGELWEMLRVDGEMNAGAGETIEVWHSRWSDVDEIVKSLAVTNDRKIYQEPLKPIVSPQTPPATATSFSAAGAFGSSGSAGPGAVTTPVPSSVKSSRSSGGGAGTAANNVSNIMHSLDPSHTSNVSAPFALSSPPPSFKSRGRGQSDASKRSRDSTESLKTAASSVKSSKREREQREREQREREQREREQREREQREREQREKEKEQRKKIKSPQLMPEDLSDYLGVIGIAGGAIAVPTLPLPRTKSVPPLTKSSSFTSASQSSHSASVSANVSSSSSSSSSKPPVIDLSPIDDSFIFSHEDERVGRNERKPSFRRKLSETIRSTSKPRSNNHRPGSSKGLNNGTSISAPQHPPPSAAAAPSFKDDPVFFNQTNLNLGRDSWSSAKAKYTCRVIHPCKPPAVVSYFSFPFFTLVEGDMYQILQEAGHPSIHPKLPLYVDDGEDCLLLCRNEAGLVGWALASFLEPIQMFGS